MAECWKNTICTALDSMVSDPRLYGIKKYLPKNDQNFSLIPKNRGYLFWYGDDFVVKMLFTIGGNLLFIIIILYSEFHGFGW